MIDMKLLRETPELVRENIRKKYQDAKLPLVDEAIELDKALDYAAHSVKKDEWYDRTLTFISPEAE